MNRRPAGFGALLATAALATAACSSGDSAITAGNDSTTTGAAPATTTAPASTADATGDSTGDSAGDSGSATTVSGPATTTAPSATTTPPVTAPPTTAPPLDSLPACPTGALDGAEGPVDITYWHGLTAHNEEALTQLVDQYNASQDRVVVHLENQGGYLEAIDKYYQSGESARPDVIMFPEYGFQQAIDSATFVPISACIESSGFDTSVILPTALDSYTQSDIAWGLPFNVSNALLYYNRQVFEDAGLDPDRPPATFDELYAMSKQIVDSGAASYGVSYDTGIDNGGGWFLEQWFANAGEEYADNGNGRRAPATKVLFDGPTGVELYTALQTMAEDGLLVSVGENPGGSDSFLKLADQTEPAAITFGTSAALGTVVEVLGSGLIPGIGVEDIGVGPMPSVSGEASSLIGGGANYIVDGHGDEVTAAAWDFVTYLLTPEVQSFWAQTTGYIPIVDGAVDLEPLASEYANDPRTRVAYDQLANSPDDTAHAGAVIGPHRQVRSTTSGAIAAVLAGADVESTLAAAAATANALIEQYNALN